MALPKQTLRFAMSGLDQGKDPKIAQGMLLLENCRQERQSEFVKRNGLVPCTGAYDDDNLATYKGRPVLFGSSGVHVLDEAGTVFNKVDDAGFMDAEVSPYGIGANAMAQVCEVCEGDNVIAVFYQKLDKVSDTTTYHLTTYEKSSGRQLDTETLKSLCHVLLVGSTIVYVVAPNASDAADWSDLFDSARAAVWTDLQPAGSTVVENAGITTHTCAVANNYWQAGNHNAPTGRVALSEVGTYEGLVMCETKVTATTGGAYNGAGFGLWEDSSNVDLLRLRLSDGACMRRHALADTWTDSAGDDGGSSFTDVYMRLYWNNTAETQTGLPNGDTLAANFIKMYSSRDAKATWVSCSAAEEMGFTPTHLVFFAYNGPAYEVAETANFDYATIEIYSRMQWGTIHATTGIIATPVLMTAGSNAAGTFDVCAIHGASFVVLHQRQSDGYAEAIVASTITGTPGYRASTVTGASVHALACWLQDTDEVAIAVATTVSELVQVAVLVASTLAVQDALVTMYSWTTADGKAQEVTGIATSATEGELFAACGPMVPADEDDASCKVIKQTYSGVSTTLAAGAVTDPFQEGCRLVSQAFEDTSGAIMVVCQRQGDFLDGLGKLCFVITSTDQLMARMLVDKAVLNNSAAAGYLGKVTDRTDAWTFGLAKQSGYETSVPVAVRLEKVTDGIRAVEAHGLLVLPGAHPWVFTGQEVVELGFVHYPDAPVVTPTELLDVLNDVVEQYGIHRLQGIAPDSPACHNTAGGNAAHLVTATDPATTLAEGIALANDMKAKYTVHIASTGAGEEHDAADATNTVAAADATDYQTLHTLVAELVTDYSAHRTQAGVHNANDTRSWTKVVADGSLDDGLHGFQVTYERTLTSGHRDQSAPSVMTSLDNEADEGVEVTVGELHHTKASATIAMYRTEALKSVAHRSQRQANDKTAYEATIPDSQSDDDVAEEPYIYTTGNVLENLPPPPSRTMWVHQERLFAVNREDEAVDVRYSKQFVDGAGIAFHDVLQVKCSPTGGRIVAGASMMGRGVLLKKSSIYTFYGKGLGVLGTGSGYSTPELVDPAIGCVNSKTMVETPAGLMFESADGIYLLSKKFIAIPIGRPVKYHTDNVTLTGAAHVKDRHCVVWSSDGVALVYDYIYSTWSTYKGYSGDDICVDDDYVTWLKGTGSGLSYENRSVWTDGTGEILDAVPMLIRSAWLAMDEYQKLHAIGILGQARSDCTIRVRVAFDYRMDANGFPDWEYNVTFDTNALGYHEADDHYTDTGTASTSDNALLLNIQIARRCRSFCIEISDETRSDTVTKGFSVAGLELSVTPKKGLFQPGSGRQMTS